MSEEVKYLWIFVTYQGLIWPLALFLSIRWRGIQESIRFLVPTLLAAFALETAGIVSGKYSYPAYSISIPMFGHEVPVIIMLGWSATLFFLREISYKITSRVHITGRRIRLFIIAAMTGFIGVLYDLFLDTIANFLGWWHWPNPSHEVCFYGVPVTNFSVWFVFLFFLTIFFHLIEEAELPEIQKNILAIVGLPIIGILMLSTQLLIKAFFHILGWV